MAEPPNDWTVVSYHRTRKTQVWWASLTSECLCMLTWVSKTTQKTTRTAPRHAAGMKRRAPEASGDKPLETPMSSVNEALKTSNFPPLSSAVVVPVATTPQVQCPRSTSGSMPFELTLVLKNIRNNAPRVADPLETTMSYAAVVSKTVGSSVQCNPPTLRTLKC